MGLQKRMDVISRQNLFGWRSWRLGHRAQFCLIRPVCHADILAVEAYHAGTIRTALYFNQNSPTKWPGIDAAQFAQLFSNLRNNADGPANDDQGILSSGANAGGSDSLNSDTVNSDTVQSNIVPVDSNALVFDRTPAQVGSSTSLGHVT